MKIEVDLDKIIQLKFYSIIFEGRIVMKVPARIDPSTGDYEERLSGIIAQLWPPEKQKPKRTRPPVGGLNFSNIKPSPVHRYVFLGFPRPDTWTIHMIMLLTKKEIQDAIRRVETGEEVPLP